jgi:hypothetical protein
VAIFLDIAPPRAQVIRLKIDSAIEHCAIKNRKYRVVAQGQQKSNYLNGTDV